jgi:FG-GAP repeat protein
MRLPTSLRITSSLLVVVLGVAWRPAFAQVPVVSTYTLTPTADDLGDPPQYSTVEFGAAVAIDGDRVAIGMPNYTAYVGTAAGTGRVGIYERSTEGWRRTATLSPSNPDELLFGRDIDLDGDTVAITARSAAYVFRKKDGEWRQIGRVALGDPDRLDEAHVAYDNGILAISRIAYDEDGYLPGMVYLYKHSAKHGLQQIAKLQASDGFRGDRFGASLAIEHGMLVVGAPPAAYVFARHGHDWTERQKLSGSTAGTGPSGESSGFGASVAIHNRTILAGAPAVDVPHNPDDDDITSPEGVSYVFLPYRGGWFESQVLNAEGQFYLGFGTKVAMGRGMVAAMMPSVSPFYSTEQGSVAVFDWVGQELRYGREAASTDYGWRATDIDFSGRTLVMGMNADLYPSPGRVSIVEYAED